jgi:hypothetical protein
VRRAFLCGKDELTGKSYDHRRELIRNRLEFLAGVMGIEVLGYVIMRNHFHTILRSRHDLVAAWADDQVALKWWLLCPARKNKDGSPAEPTEFELNQIRTDKRGSMPAELKPIMERLGVSAELWVECVANFRKWFRSSVGRPKPMSTHADSRSHNRAISISSSRRLVGRLRFGGNAA